VLNMTNATDADAALSKRRIDQAPNSGPFWSEIVSVLRVAGKPSDGGTGSHGVSRETRDALAVMSGLGKSRRGDGIRRKGRLGRGHWLHLSPTWRTSVPP